MHVYFIDVQLCMVKIGFIFNCIPINLTVMCEEERRAARTLANRHVSTIYACTEDARASIAKMGKYAEEMIGITRNHMQATLLEATRAFETPGGNREAAAAQRSGSIQK